MTIPGTSTGRAGSGEGSDRRHAATAARGKARRPALPRAAAFWLVAGVLFLLFFAAAAPSPLYGVYQAQWRFSAITLTAVFAAYAVLLLVTLLVFGSLSDYLGRRRVILAAWRWPRAPAGCSWRRTVSGCCSRLARCTAPPSAPRPARWARR